MSASLIGSLPWSLAALALVLALMWGLRRLAVRLLPGHLPGAARGALGIEQTLALDPRRRLVLVRWGKRRLLLLTGGAQDLLIAEDEAPAEGALPAADTPPAPARFSHSLPRLALLLPLGAALALAWPPLAAQAQTFSVDLGAAGAGGTTARLMQIAAALTVLSLAPSLLVMLTAFTRIIIVLSLLRGALGTQSTPPNTVLIGLALFLTFFIMQPVLDAAWSSGLLPLAQGRIETAEGLTRAAEPFRHFMLANARPADLRLFLDLAHLPPPADAEAMPWRALVPGFLVGELRRGFEMGFLLYLPFLVIDMVIATILMSLGMMMLPPNVVSLPFKLIFFVLVDGWRLTCGSVAQSFVSG
jgi:flagellar biosynthetic protein FliP